MQVFLWDYINSCDIENEIFPKNINAGHQHGNAFAYTFMQFWDKSLKLYEEN